jgi:ubiquinone/menaquinone biosynthesis C-methylase UbiE
VFARLSIHYFNDEQTEHILDEFDRVLKPNSLLFISVKLTNVGNVETTKHMRNKEDWEHLVSGCFNVVESKVVFKQPYDYDPAPSNLLEIYARPLD